MRKKELKTVITFETTTQAIGMESACKKHQIAGRLIPVPKRSQQDVNSMDDPFRK